MPRHNVPNRIAAVLACVAPLTPRQLARALGYNPLHIGPQVYAMYRDGRIRRVVASGRQYRLHRGATCAYALVGH